MWLFLVGLALLTGDVLSQDGAPASGESTFQDTISSYPVRDSFGSAGNPCNPSPCGPNTICELNANGVALCKCSREDYVPDGNTIIGCKPQCTIDNDCPNDYSCQRNKCARVCIAKACGLHAICTVRNHRAACSCPSGYGGDPNQGCSFTIPEIRAPEHLPVDPCNPSPCGINSDCKARVDRAVCSCPRGYEGNPLEHCRRGECTTHGECPNHLACQALKCINPCHGSCGIDAECLVKLHQPICSCRKNFIGNALESCRRITEYDICHPTPCGKNTNCRVKTDRSGNMRAVCSCRGNYIGSPLTACRPECVNDNECSSNQHCQNERCTNPCLKGCGENAHCEVRNYRAVCTCPKYYEGDPYTKCFTECTKHEDCRDFEACSLFKCIDPCIGSCGRGAECKVETHTAICFCPKQYTGDPFVSCRPFTPDDLCRGNPCGTNANCFPGKDRSGNDRPVCVCETGYIGNPLVMCQEGECRDHDNCNDNEACYEYTCRSPCYTKTGSVCGENAHCAVKNHTPICSCPRGYSGSPLQSCRIAPNARIAGHSYRKQ